MVFKSIVYFGGFFLSHLIFGIDILIAPLEELQKLDVKVRMELWRKTSKKAWLQKHKYIDEIQVTSEDLRILKSYVENLRLMVGKRKAEQCPAFSINSKEKFDSLSPVGCLLDPYHFSNHEGFLKSWCYPCNRTPDDVRIEMIATELTKRKPEPSKETLDNL